VCAIHGVCKCVGCGVWGHVHIHVCLAHVHVVRVRDVWDGGVRIVDGHAVRVCMCEKRFQGSEAYQLTVSTSS